MGGGKSVKTWAGQQSVLDIANSMQRAHTAVDWSTADSERCLFISAQGCGLPFNFDADLGHQGSSLDVGFSFDSLAGNAATRIVTSARPTLELLAFISLQRARPLEDRERNLFHYCTWQPPVSVAVIASRASGLMTDAASRGYAFRLLYPTKYLKRFLPAQPHAGVAHV